MNSSVIKDILNGTRGHRELIKNSDEYWMIMDEVVTLSDTLIQKISPEQKEIFDKLTLSLMGLEAEAVDTHFIEGFRLGALIIIECFK